MLLVLNNRAQVASTCHLQKKLISNTVFVPSSPVRLNSEDILFFFYLDYPFSDQSLVQSCICLGA